MRCEHLHDSAVYVLGALSPPEREAYERHLVDCAECRAEVAEFSDLPGLLGRLDPEIAAQILMASDDASSSSAQLLPPIDASAARAADSGSAWAGPTAVPGQPARWAGPTAAPLVGADAVNGAAVDPLLPRVLDRARATRRTERRRRRWRTAGTALAAAFIAVLAVFGVRAVGVGQPDYAAMQEVSATVPITASLALESVADGTLVQMDCAYKDKDKEIADSAKWTYKLVVVPKTGEPEEIDTWTARAGDELHLTAHSQIARADIKRVEIRRGDGTPLLSLAT
jgi:anti-sigma factor RsiW